MSKMKRFWRKAGFIGAFVGVITLAMYPIAIDPYLNQAKWQQRQLESREHYSKTKSREEIQPGGMKVWSDPFDRKKE